ncbi:MAG: hypothetical protein EOS76_01270 [Mesorhizobium sp.]|nr:hypothetical protein [Mesorhizobium sp.]RVC81955.1 hypothetical protein EN766_02135 [Mesorhizobium sp. M2A.F.Ca.ET.046.02.1.1]RWE22462.1 MAG: hypothetical protein EOS76_01270 [Mesorhizobium sp.]
MAATLNILGLAFSLIGVVVLFRYGMPYKVRTGGVTHLITHEIDEAEVELEGRYQKYGRGGLILIVLGTAFQVAANIV